MLPQDMWTSLGQHQCGLGGAWVVPSSGPLHQKKWGDFETATQEPCFRIARSSLQGLETSLMDKLKLSSWSWLRNSKSSGLSVQAIKNWTHTHGNYCVYHITYYVQHSINWHTVATTSHLLWGPHSQNNAQLQLRGVKVHCMSHAVGEYLSLCDAYSEWLQPTVSNSTR